MTPLTLRQNLTALALYVAATLLFFLPSLSSLSTSLIGPPEDNMFVLWTLWYGPESILNPALPFMRTYHLYYPDGISLFFCNYYYYGVFLTLLLKAIFSLPLIYNLLVLHTFVIGGLGAFWLVYYLTADYRSSLIGGFIYGFNPLHFAHSLHHLTIASIQFIPFFILFFMRTVRGEKRANLWWASLFLVLDALCDWNYLVYDFVFVYLAAAYLIFRRGKNSLSALKRIFWIHVIVGAVLSPLLIPMVWTVSRHAFVGKLPGQDIYVADFFGFFVPHAYHALSSWGPIQRLNASMTGNDWEKVAYLGVANLTLILLVIRRTWKESWKYFGGLAVFMVLAMGSFPHVAGNVIPVPLPYRILDAVPFLSNARCPSRILIYGYIFLSILTSVSVKWLMSQVKPGRTSKIFKICFILIFLDYFSVGTGLTPVVLPPCYAQIQQDADKDFGILELPWDGARHMMYQTLLGIPCVQGYMGRRVELALSDRLVYDLRRLDVQKKMLVRNKVKYVVIHKNRLAWTKTEEEKTRYLNGLRVAVLYYSKIYDKIYEDENAATFKVY